MNGIRETTGRVWIGSYLHFRSVPVWMEYWSCGLRTARRGDAARVGVGRRPERVPRGGGSPWRRGCLAWMLVSQRVCAWEKTLGSPMSEILNAKSHTIPQPFYAVLVSVFCMLNICPCRKIYYSTAISLIKYTIIMTFSLRSKHTHLPILDILLIYLTDLTNFTT
jgi:hypothetical protein